MSDQKKKFKIMLKCLELLKRDNAERKQKHGKKRSINEEQNAYWLIMYLLLC